MTPFEFDTIIDYSLRAHIFARNQRFSVISVNNQEDRIWRRFSVNSPLDQVSFDAFPLSTQYKCQSIHNLSFMAYLLSKSRANNQKYREQ